MSKYTAPPNPQGDRPRSMRSLAVFSTKYLAAWIATYGSPCFLSRSGDPWKGPSWGLGIKDTQSTTIYIPLAWYYSS